MEKEDEHSKRMDRQQRRQSCEMIDTKRQISKSSGKPYGREGEFGRM